MAAVTHLDRAPITEALIDIRVKLKDGLDVAIFNSLRDKIASDYPSKKERRRWQGTIEFKQGETPIPAGLDLGSDGLLLTSSDEKQVVQARLDGFTFSRLKPYKTWDDLLLEAKKNWNLYLETAKPEVISRIALRYINNIEFPLGGLDFDDYLTSVPKVPKGLPQRLASFVSRVVVPVVESNATAIVTQVFEPNLGQAQNVINVLLDIDVFVESQFSPNDETIWAEFAKLHNLKNLIFFDSITPKTVELLK
jgi:uncharacterized protein (TIGR04255 family)